MSLFDKRIPVKGKFVKETSGYREADVQQFIRELFEHKRKFGSIGYCDIDKFAGKELCDVNVLNSETKQGGQDEI